MTKSHSDYRIHKSENIFGFSEGLQERLRVKLEILFSFYYIAAQKGPIKKRILFLFDILPIILLQPQPKRKIKNK